jgi:hypothetical protein
LVPVNVVDAASTGADLKGLTDCAGVGRARVTGAIGESLHKKSDGAGIRGNPYGVIAFPAALSIGFTRAARFEKATSPGLAFTVALARPAPEAQRKSC